MKNFFGHVFVTFRGALIGQLVPVLAMPIISRLYAPEEYGIFASLLSLSVIMSVLVMLQLEISVVLPKDEETASRLARSAFQIGVFNACLMFAALLVLYPLLSQLGAFVHLKEWIFLTPVLAFFLSFLQLCNHMASRERHYREIGTSAAGAQIVNCLVAILIGLKNAALGGLVLARFAGQVGAIALYRHAVRWLATCFKQGGLVSWADMCATIGVYKKFLQFTLPYTLISSLSRELITVILMFFHYPQAAGFYALVRSILMMPVSLLSTSLGQIFYREAASALDSEDFRNFSYTLMIAIALIMAPACVYIAAWGPILFSMIFGAEWADAGIFATVYMPLSLLFVLTGWIGRIFEVRSRQDLLFKIQIVFDALALTTLCSLLIGDFKPIEAVAGYIGFQCLFLITQLALVFRLMHFDMKRYAYLLGAASGAALFQFLVHTGLSYTPLTLWGVWGGETLITLCFSLGLIAFFWRHFRQTHPL